jgi:hypothetical protein
MALFLRPEDEVRGVFFSLKHRRRGSHDNKLSTSFLTIVGELH